MGFGRPVSHAVLGEPLRVSMPLRLEAGEALDASCVSVEIFYGDDKLSASQIQVSLTGGSGREASVQVRTTAPITEPIVTYHVSAGCQAKINRQFVALADPPGMSFAPVRVTAPVMADMPQATPDAASRTTRPVVAGASQGGTAGSGSDARGGDAERTGRAVRADREEWAQARRAERSARRARSAPPVLAVRPDTTAVAIAQRRTSLSLSPKVAPSPAAGRLVLDPVEVDAATQPDLRMSGSLSTLSSSGDAASSPEVLQRRAAAAALWQAMNLSPEEVARDRQKLLAQERMLADIQGQASQAGAASSATVNTSGQSSQAGGSTLLYWVSALALLGLGLCVALFVKLRRRQQAEAVWWQSQMQEPKAEGAPPAPEAAAVVREQPPSRPLDPNPLPKLSRADAERASARLKAAASSPVAEAKPVITPSAATPPAAPVRKAVVPEPTPARLTPPHHPAMEAMREVSVEELIDLEQQAEFFVVLGQDDAAVDLLESHVHAVSGSPLPFLKLLEIYQRVNKRDDYERVQQAFNQRFNAHAPTWESNLQHGHELADYPGIVERLQALWPSPVNAMEVLEKSLTRPESSADTFDLPAYRELLFLYSVARDLSEREMGERPRVDLLASEPAKPTAATPFDLSDDDSVIEPLMATRPIKAMPDVQPMISLDLRLDDLELDDGGSSSYRDVPGSVPAKTDKPNKSAASDSDAEHIDLPGLSD